MKLTREMLIIEPNKYGQDCNTCPFGIYAVDVASCCENEINGKLFETINCEFASGCFCNTHSITLKPEFK